MSAAKDIGCAAGCDDVIFLTTAAHDRHLTAEHDTTYALATGEELTAEECDAIGVYPHNRAIRGEVTLSDLTELEQRDLWMFRTHELAADASASS